MPISDYLRQLRRRIGSDLLLMPSATVLVFDDRDRVLLVRNSETGIWVAPGGAMDPFESPADAAVRETWEETGLWVAPVRLMGVFGGPPEFLVTYSNGDQVSYIMTVFEGRVIAGEPHPDGTETTEVAFFSSAELAQIDVAPWVHAILTADFQNHQQASFEPPTWRPPVGT